MTATVFESQISWLSKRYRIVTLSEYLGCLNEKVSNRQRCVAITFDDGLKTTFESVYPFCEYNRIPITIFVSTLHLENGDLLWFSYLNALCSEKIYQSVKADDEIYDLSSLSYRQKAWHTLISLAKASGDPMGFCKKLADFYPIPSDIASRYGGMTHSQILSAANSCMVEIGSHTVTHPFLSQLSGEAQNIEILRSKQILSDISGKPVRFFAYPSGDYDVNTLDIVEKVGFDAAFAVKPKELGVNPLLEVSRMGVYSHSLIKLALKTTGLANIMRRFGLPVG